jgi:Flp pilus assembly pilin Flp
MSFTLYLKSLLERFLENEQGAELAEYAVGVALLVAITIVVFQVLGDAIVDENTGTGARIENASWTPPAP